jgi:hypothetical protein
MITKQYQVGPSVFSVNNYNLKSICFSPTYYTNSYITPWNGVVK